MPGADDSPAAQPSGLDEGLDVTALEQIAGRGWQGTTTEALGDWLLRAGHGFTGRANSVLPLGSPGCEPAEALRAIREFYRAVGLPAVIQMPEDRPGSALAGLDLQLQAGGWRPYHSTAVMTAAVVDVAAACPRSDLLPPSRFDPVPSDAWLSGYLYRGNPLPPTAVAVLTNAASPVFLTVPGDDPSGQHPPGQHPPGQHPPGQHPSGQHPPGQHPSGQHPSGQHPPGQHPSCTPRGVARGVVTEGWLGVTAVTVDAGHRRTGIGRHVMGELARWAADQAEPAHSVYLQVDEANPVALAMYRRLGFARHHGYHYLADPGA
ncbi:hypothetical protein ABIB25_002119 [Nakamurella sp. UYEF19]|uniref:GNAT family N-acetyltransferase n=1 Tax=Nakamurella sp. UYEF19 TaxID=1756392 RepID=UPI0033930D68